MFHDVGIKLWILFLKLYTSYSKDSYIDSKLIKILFLIFGNYKLGKNNSLKSWIFVFTWDLKRIVNKNASEVARSHLVMRAVHESK